MASSEVNEGINDSLEVKSIEELLKERGELIAMLSAESDDAGGDHLTIHHHQQQPNSFVDGEDQYSEFIESFQQQKTIEASFMSKLGVDDDRRQITFDVDGDDDMPATKRCKTDLGNDCDPFAGCPLDLAFGDEVNCKTTSWEADDLRSSSKDYRFLSSSHTEDDVTSGVISLFDRDGSHSKKGVPEILNLEDDRLPLLNRFSGADGADDGSCFGSNMPGEFSQTISSHDADNDTSSEGLINSGGDTSSDYKQGMSALRELGEILANSEGGCDRDKGRGYGTVRRSSIDRPQQQTSSCCETDRNNEEIDQMLDESLQNDHGESVKETTDNQLKDDELKLLGIGGTEGNEEGDGASVMSLNGEILRPAHIREKIVLRNRGTEYFEVLPDGWIDVTHNSGIPVYLHKETRVCTLSRPYFIGPGSVRNHDVPLASIPCLHQKRMKELDQQKLRATNEATTAADTLTNPSAVDSASTTNVDDIKMKLAMTFKMPEVKVQTTEDYASRNLKPEQLHEYTKKIFEFEKIKGTAFMFSLFTLRFNYPFLRDKL
ncbi:unnamed protein product [Soboliphyme baturini]|uniref:BRCT domain-containing protein n=1 Tax=Soboliphyme baturini TaxID=241478 RepID=A0A183J874_9BILA|nr:unnamed protein product [Soboliphyme baturini]